MAVVAMATAAHCSVAPCCSSSQGCRCQLVPWLHTLHRAGWGGLLSDGAGEQGGCSLPPALQGLGNDQTVTAGAGNHHRDLVNTIIIW